MNWLEIILGIYLVSLIIGTIIYLYEHFFRRPIIRNADDLMAVLGIVGVPVVNTIMIFVIFIAKFMDWKQERKNKRNGQKPYGIYKTPNKPPLVIHLDKSK